MNTNLEENPILKIQKFIFLTEKLLDRELSLKFAVSFSQFRVLAVIHFHPGLSQKDIASFQDTTQAAISRHIVMLEKDGLVALGTNTENRKEHNLHLTKKGSELLEKALKFVELKLNKFLKKLEPKRARDLDTIAEDLIFAIREECKDK
jgi:DNA-binding MarR family transcriptional regulator